MKSYKLVIERNTGWYARRYSLCVDLPSRRYPLCTDTVPSQYYVKWWYR